MFIYFGHFKLLKMKRRLLIEIFRLRIRIIPIYKALELLKTLFSARDEKLLAILSSIFSDHRYTRMSLAQLPY